MNIDDTGTMRVNPSVELTPAWSVARGQVRAWVLMGILLLTFALLWPTTESLMVRWTDAVVRSYTHGGLIPLMSCFILWRRRAEFAVLPATPSLPACLATVAMGVAWLLAYRGGVQIGHQVLLPVIVFGLSMTVFGAAIARRALLPIAFLYFALPIWDVLVPALQWLSTFAVRGLLSVLDIPVYFDGLQFHLPSGQFEIAGGCSGLHFFVVGLAIATFYGELHADPAGTRVGLVLLATFFAFVTNWIRIAIIIAAGHYTQMQHSLVSNEHYTFGWGMFAVAMLIYFLIVRRWPAPVSREVVVNEPPAGAGVPARGLALAVAAIALPAMSAGMDGNLADPRDAARHGLPAELSGWLRTVYDGDAAPRFINADLADALRFESGNRAVLAFSATYFEQRQGKELADFNNRPLGEDLRASNHSVALPEGPWREVEVRDRTGGRWLVRLRYRVDDWASADTRRAQVYYAAASLVGNPLSSATVLRTRCQDDCVDARALLDTFVTDAQLAMTAESAR